jgi:hypothetical protein
MDGQSWLQIGRCRVHQDLRDDTESEAGNLEQLAVPHLVLNVTRLVKGRPPHQSASLIVIIDCKGEMQRVS